MSTIGHFRREADGFTGRLATLHLDTVLRLVPGPKASTKAPDFLILAGDQECGAAWRAPDGSGAILHLKLDDPSWPEPVNARLLAAEDGALPLVWIRRTDPPPA
jgi:uncharacterized protein (DUF736 family)